MLISLPLERRGIAMDSGRFEPLKLVAVIVPALWMACPTDSAVAQRADHPTVQAGAAAPVDDDGDAKPDDQAAAGQNVFTPPDRATLRLLTKARELIDQDRAAEAVRCLGAIFESPQDYFFHPDRSDPVPRSLKSEAQRLLGQMSDRGSRLYEIQYGARARQMLSEAAAAGDAVGLAEVSRRFFHTQAGYEATLLLGLHHLDHGRPLAGALEMERLRQVSPAADQFEPAMSLSTAICWIQAGRPEKAGQALSMLKERYPRASIQVAGEEILLFRDHADTLDWLTGLLGRQAAPEVEEPGQWAMFRGNAARNASTTGDRPLFL